MMQVAYLVDEPKGVNDGRKQTRVLSWESSDFVL